MIEVDADEVVNVFGSVRYFNIMILGVAVATGELGIEKEVFMKEIEKRVPPQFAEKNKEAFLAGYGKGSRV